LAYRTFGLRPDLVAPFEGFIDNAGKLVVGHGRSGSFGWGLSGAEQGMSSCARRAKLFFGGNGACIDKSAVRLWIWTRLHSAVHRPSRITSWAGVRLRHSARASCPGWATRSSD